ncbi:MAG: hypothetical protein ACK4MH_06745 [Brevundimonas sp.]|uniref:hypothetical protein n=1 Tax=Brevundimonas sp. TaxID=1871086 RepID=UPI00391B5CB9
MINKILLLLIICVALAALRAVAVVLVALLGLALVVAFIMHPRHTVVFLATFTLSALTVVQPVACITGVVIIVVVLTLARNRRHRLRRPIGLSAAGG